MDAMDNLPSEPADALREALEAPEKACPDARLKQGATKAHRPVEAGMKQGKCPNFPYPSPDGDGLVDVTEGLATLSFKLALTRKELERARRGLAVLKDAADLHRRALERLAQELDALDECPSGRRQCSHWQACQWCWTQFALDCAEQAQRTGERRRPRTTTASRPPPSGRLGAE